MLRVRNVAMVASLVVAGGLASATVVLADDGFTRCDQVPTRSATLVLAQVVQPQHLPESQAAEVPVKAVPRRRPALRANGCQLAARVTGSKDALVLLARWAPGTSDLAL